MQYFVCYLGLMFLRVYPSGLRINPCASSKSSILDLVKPIKAILEDNVCHLLAKTDTCQHHHWENRA